MKRFKVYSLFGIRRAILLYPQNVKYSWRKDGLFVSFDLPSGAYATVVIDELEKMLRSAGVKS
jgi:tRNA(Glu) U13 pseudouridine synthase TruD